MAFKKEGSEYWKQRALRDKAISAGVRQGYSFGRQGIPLRENLQRVYGKPEHTVAATDPTRMLRERYRGEKQRGR